MRSLTNWCKYSLNNGLGYIVFEMTQEDCVRQLPGVRSFRAHDYERMVNSTLRPLFVETSGP